MTANPYLEMTNALMAAIQARDDRRKEDINVTTERRTRVQPNLANQAFEDLCHVCFAAGCTCADEGDLT